MPKQVTLPNGAVVTIDDKGNIISGDPTNGKGTVSAASKQAASTSSVSNSQVINLPNLAPGMTGPEVKILQQWLIQQGYSIPNGATGYYGDETKAAVTQWQSKAGFDTQGNPGYFGPISKNFLSGKPVPPVGGDVATDTKAPDAPANNANSGGLGSVNPDIAKTPENAAFRDSAAYRALPNDLKSFVDMSYNLITVGVESDAKTFAAAIEQAKAIADPYLAAQLTLAKGEIFSSVAKANNDYETAHEIITRTRDELLKNVSLNKDALTLDEQATLAREATQYGYDLQDIANTAAEKGLTFATGLKSRTEAETRRTTQYQDVIQSDQRDYNLKVAELEAKAQSGDTDAQAKLAALNKDKSTTLADIGRNAESVLGTNIATSMRIEGYTPVGGVTGTIKENVDKKMLADVAGFVDLQKGFTSKQ